MDASTTAMLHATKHEEMDEDDDTVAKEEVLSRHCSWESYLTARLVDTHDLQLMRRYDKKSSAVRKSLLLQEGEAYAKVFTKILRNVSKTETVQYVLCLVDQILREDSTNAELFHENEIGDPCTTFLSLLRKDDWLERKTIVCGGWWD
eukprot:jgi/Pico_ML_1/53111/g3719.t1